MSKSKFLLKSPRRETDTRAKCFASEELFLPWDKMNKDARFEFERNGPIPCEGGGVPGSWCEECRFGKVDSPEDV